MTEAQQLLFTQGVSDVIERQALEQLLGSGRNLVVKLGVDPTSVDLHLGHAVVLRKLKQFEQLGHQTILVIGDFTAGIGDPAGVNATRPVLTREQVADNMKTYLEQAGKILDLTKTKVVHNSDWLDQMKLADLLAFANRIGVGTMIEREDFKSRLQANQFVGLHELLYPLVQAIDSFHLKADVELGGWDQRLNLLMGRELQKKCGMAPQQLMLMKPLVGLDGERKMSSSYGNYIAIGESADQMFGKIMSIPDTQTANWAELAGWMSPEKVEQLKTLHPKEAKLAVARAVVDLYYPGQEEMVAGRFSQTFASKEVSPELAQPVKIENGNISATALVAQAAGVSNSEAGRLFSQGAVRLDGQPITETTQLEIKNGAILQIGKHRFFRLDLS